MSSQRDAQSTNDADADVDTDPPTDADSHRSSVTEAPPLETGLYGELREDIAPLLTSDQFTLVEEYWLQEYQSAAAIFINTDTGEHSYHVLEPDLSEDEAFLYDTVESRLREKILYREDFSDADDPHDILRTRSRDIIDKLRDTIPQKSTERMLYYLERNLLGHGRIEPLMHDSLLEEISCNGPGDKPLFVYHQEYDNVATNIRFDEGELRPYVRKLAQRSGKDISTANPTQGAVLPDGSRIQMTLDEVSPEGESFTIRKFSDDPFTPVDLIKRGTFSIDQLAYLWYIVQYGVSGIFAGGTGAGKTTSLNATALFADPGKKFITIEDTREVKIPQENYVATLTREGFSDAGENTVDMFDLVKQSLRKRPDYLVLGEVRGREAYNLFQAMNTGHTSFATLHADSMMTALSRLQTKPMNIPKSLIAELGFTTVQTVATVDGEEVRRCKEIYEVIDLDADINKLHYRSIYEWDPKTDRMIEKGDSNIIKKFRKAGKSPDEAIANRKQVLRYLVNNDITDYGPVSSIIRSFMRSPEDVLEQVEADYINLEELAALEDQAVYRTDTNGTT